MDELAEARSEMEPAFDGVAHGIEPELAGLVEQRTSVEDGQRAYVLRRAPAGPRHQSIERAEPIDDGHTVRPLH
jgi:hypothetical protein